ncbi:hypothetical protein L1887_11983 [Cichorium endivia]|nr:hypothetical protein L1887_11983 [Cichorium endivia]
MHRFLLSSPVRTLNPEEADWFYTPVYTTCGLTPNGLPLPFKSPRMMRSAIELICLVSGSSVIVVQNTAAPFGDKLSCSLIHSQQLLFETDQLYLLGTCMHEAFRLGLRRCKIIR